MRRLLDRLFGSRLRAAAALPPDVRDLIASIRARRLTYLSERKLASIAATCLSLEEKGLPGLFVEAGCALGGSAVLISRVKSEGRPLRVYDVFGMIPAPSERDGDDVHERYSAIRRGESEGIGGDTYYGYEENLLDVVRSNLREFGVDESRDRVALVRGLVQDTLVLDEPVAFAHVDVDWYEPVKTCLERIAPRLVVGGSIILDDYRDWSGCREATDEYFSGQGGFERDLSAGSLKVTRVGA